MCFLQPALSAASHSGASFLRAWHTSQTSHTHSTPQKDCCLLGRQYTNTPLHGIHTHKFYITKQKHIKPQNTQAYSPMHSTPLDTYNATEHTHPAQKYTPATIYIHIREQIQPSTQNMHIRHTPHHRTLTLTHTLCHRTHTQYTCPKHITLTCL